MKPKTRIVVTIEKEIVPEQLEHAKELMNDEMAMEQYRQTYGHALYEAMGVHKDASFGFTFEILGFDEEDSEDV